MDLRKIVFENLDAALDNGYFEDPEGLQTFTVLEIANDMLAYAADIEDIDDPQLLVPFIAEWRAEHNK